MSFRFAARWIKRNTVVCQDSLTPRYKLNLITEACPLWMSTPDECPFPDPYWAFYWPGGQALTRYVLENRKMFRDSTIFDFGCGCGSTSIAATDSDATSVICNDIDEYALLATKMNYRLNNISDRNVLYTNDDYLTESNEKKLLSLLKGETYLMLGDMFYDSEFAEKILLWLRRIKEKKPVRVLVGDPDRHPLVEPKYMNKYNVPFNKILLAEYPLPGYVIKHHYGFNTAKVFEITM